MPRLTPAAAMQNHKAMNFIRAGWGGQIYLASGFS
jgi:hypothetical protein